MSKKNNEKYMNFLQKYVENIYSRIKEIDLFIKTSDDYMSIPNVADILSISTIKVKSIMEENKIKYIDKVAFFVIMLNGNSDICTFYRREVECGSPYTYSPENIAYIYDLEFDKVNKICNRLSIKEVTPINLPLIFSQIV